MSAVQVVVNRQSPLVFQQRSTYLLANLGLSVTERLRAKLEGL